MLQEALRALRSAQRPVLIFGAGIHRARAESPARAFARLTGIPVAPTWGARDVFSADDGTITCVGGFGTHGTRAANFAVQNADWILSVGSRLDSKATGTPREYFARAAAIFMVDIDAAEVRKFGGHLGRSFCGAQADAGLFLRDALREVRADRASYPDFAVWRERCARWVARYPACSAAYGLELGVNPYVLFRELSAQCEDDVIVSDTGLALAWLMQGFEFKRGQRFIHAFNQTPMGYGLPAAIGAAAASPGSRVVLVTGDGGLMLNIQELPLIARRRLPIKILLVNNAGHGMCRQTQDQWLGGKYYSTSAEDLAFPDFVKLAHACDVAAGSVVWARDVPRGITALLGGGREPRLLDAKVSAEHRLIPQVPYGRPNEDGSPLLAREDLAEEMIVETVG